ncbi:16208_t:CDS:2, partial [Acaulospora colombiana]
RSLALVLNQRKHLASSSQHVMRAVIEDPSADITCTNCRERGIRCKDDYADSKKQLRRGKRINQLELEDNLQDQSEELPMYNTPLRPRTIIPTLKP